MDNTCLVYLEVNLTLLHLTDSLGHIHGHSTALGVGHQATRTEDTTQRTNLAHDGGHGDDDIHVGPSTLNLLDVFIQTHIVGTSLLGSSLSIGCTEAQYTGNLTGTVGQ